MKIAISVDTNSSDASIASNFGRCQWICLYETRTGKSAFYENPGILYKEEVGCKTAGFLINEGVNMIIAKRFGTKVVNLFRESNIQIVIPQKSKTLAEIINILENK